jgi:HSP20 family molecular chaperone IbpA
MQRLRREFRTLPTLGARERYEVQVGENDARILIDVPGYSPDELRLLEVKDELRLVGRGDWLGTFKLPKDVEREGISASVENGRMTITIPFVAKPVPREIPIQAGEAVALTVSSTPALAEGAASESSK